MAHSILARSYVDVGAYVYVLQLVLTSCDMHIIPSTQLHVYSPRWGKAGVYAYSGHLHT